MVSGWEPLSYLIPEFSLDNRFIQLGGDLPVQPGTPFGRIAQTYIDKAPGALKAISNIPITDGDRITLSRFGLSLSGLCSKGTTAAHTIHICDLERVPPSDSAAAAPLRLGEKVDFRRDGNAWIYESFPGCWSSDWVEPWGTWATSDAPWCSRFVFRLPDDLVSDLRMSAMVRAFIPPNPTDRQEVTVEINGKRIGVWIFNSAAPSLQTLTIPKDFLSPKANVLVFRNQHAVSQNDAKILPGDNRKLNVGFEWLMISE
jgi:hypothetical protein